MTQQPPIAEGLQQVTGASATPSGSRASHEAPAGLGDAVSIPSAAELVRLLSPIVSGGTDSCLKGTPMIPLHRDTVAATLTHLEVIVDDQRDAPKAICGYPIPGWRLDAVEYDRRTGHPDGWIVTLKREGLHNCATHIAMARSDVGPLEAWDEAIRIAQRDDARRASTISGEAAIPQGDA